MIKLSDYIFKRLVEKYAVKHIFMVSGGGAMHLNDSIGRCEGIEYICNHHEQACAIAAEGYSRVSNQLAVVNVTTGPGGLNTLTGLMGQWTDSVPVLYISGQVKYETTIHSCPEINLRQLGDQEVDIISVVKPLTKYAVMVTDPTEIEYHLDKAIDLAITGRPGPVWLDIPMNVQAAMIDENNLQSLEPLTSDSKNSDFINNEVESLITKLAIAKKPVIVPGRGVRLAQAEKKLYELIDLLKIPVLSTLNGYDLIPTNHSCSVGRIGSQGDRAGNIALQNADLVIFIGTRNNIRQVSYTWQNTAKDAFKVIVDIDQAELVKPTIRADLAINCDAGSFLNKLTELLANQKIKDYASWLSWCLEKKAKYPVVLDVYKANSGKVQPYYFTNILTSLLPEDSTVVTSNATPSICGFQAGIVKFGQKYIWNSGCASMGYDLPAAIGASIATHKSKVICLAGEGSIMMNLQELATIKHHNLPIKIFVYNNLGYVSIQQTQSNFFNGNLVASDLKSGLSFPDFNLIASAFGLDYHVIEDQDNLAEQISSVLLSNEAVICEVKLQTDYKFMPKLSAEKLPDGRMISKPLDDMWPFLDREEYNQNLIKE